MENDYETKSLSQYVANALDYPKECIITVCDKHFITPAK